MKIGIKTQAFVFLLSATGAVVAQDSMWIFYPALFLMFVSAMWVDVFGPEGFVRYWIGRGRDK